MEPFEFVSVTIYDVATGEYMGNYSGPFAALATVISEDKSYLIDVTMDAQAEYIVDGAVTARPMLSLLVVGNTVQGIPDGAEITVSGPLSGETIHDTGDFTLTAEDAGTYTISVLAFPYQVSEVEIVNA